MFSMDQLNKASSTVPLSKRYRYPQQQQGPAQVANQMYQANVGAPTGYGYPGQPMPQQSTVQQQPPFGQQQQYPTSYSPYMDPNVAAAPTAPGNYASASPQPQQYSQYVAGQPPLANVYAPPPNATPYCGNPAQPNYNTNQYANNAASYNVASQFAGQVPAQPPPPPMNASYQSQPYNPQARY